ncbi:hypothetical protein HYPSUDRAFT_244279 [Hypholoma sublateritium FD-334 SS-4]|uniref:N-acetyltransferase domain-containing protein n=1 Tax=Hypholoma sublateritium (strain FD-334 SS-4) TaxID=945553 RepID=A0A0D2N0G1_HYPSF|nr:hypothetical protein HYPSUDRAFT_244279 [Hypholoma sublateritium FD-334 SS-4]
MVLKAEIPDLSPHLSKSPTMTTFALRIAIAHRETTKDSEAQLFAAPSSTQPKRMRFSHLWRAAKTVEHAFESDSFGLYMRAGEKKPIRTRTQNILFLSLWKTRQLVLTVHRGASLIVVRTGTSRPQKPIGRLIHTLLTRLSKTISSHQTTEQKKRAAELAEKSTVAVRLAIGDRVSSMIYVSLLATDPESQGHGYGGALLEAINDLADSTGQASWLQSSNTENNTFYRSHGFETAGTYYMGDGNPEWTGKPILIQIMVREPKQKSEVAQPTSIASEQRYSLSDPLSPFQCHE